jgi:hypothetical protein
VGMAFTSRVHAVTLNSPRSDMSVVSGARASKAHELPSRWSTVDLS